VRGAEPIVGGYYSYQVRRKDLKKLFSPFAAPERSHRVVKVWRVDDQGVWLAVFGDMYSDAPIPFDPDELELTTWFATLPMIRRAFEDLNPQCVHVGTVTPDELEGWEIAQRERGGFGYATATPDAIMADMKAGGYTFPPTRADRDLED